jgi:hypothetical protein
MAPVVESERRKARALNFYDRESVMATKYIYEPEFDNSGRFHWVPIFVRTSTESALFQFRYSVDYTMNIGERYSGCKK